MVGLENALDKRRQRGERLALLLSIGVAIVHALNACNDVPKRPLGNVRSNYEVFGTLEEADAWLMEA